MKIVDMGMKSLPIQRWIIAIAGLTAVGAVCYALITPRMPVSVAPRATVPAVPVTAGKAERQAVAVTLSNIGRVQTISSVSVRSRLDGVIAAVEVADGQDVKAGDVLFRLDDRAIQATIHQTEANLGRDRAQLANAKREVERFAPLEEKQYVTPQKMAELRTNVASLEGTVKADEAAVEAARVILTYTVIRAPIDGQLGTIALKVGNTIRANDTNALVQLNQMRPIYATFSVPQSHIDDIRLAMQSGALPVIANIPNDAGQPVQGKLAYIENTVDPVTNTLAVRAVFENPDTRLWPGQFVNVTLTLGTQADAVVVPAAAVQTGQQGNFVFVVKADSTVEARPVTVDRTVNEQAIVAKGLEGGETVVTSGQLRLDTGSRVTVRPPGPAVAQEPAK